MCYRSSSHLSCLWLRVCVQLDQDGWSTKCFVPVSFYFYQLPKSLRFSGNVKDEQLAVSDLYLQWKGKRFRICKTGELIRLCSRRIKGSELVKVRMVLTGCRMRRHSEVRINRCPDMVQRADRRKEQRSLLPGKWEAAEQDEDQVSELLQEVHTAGRNESSGGGFLRYVTLQRRPIVQPYEPKELINGICCICTQSRFKWRLLWCLSHWGMCPGDKWPAGYTVQVSVLKSFSLWC